MENGRRLLTNLPSAGDAEKRSTDAGTTSPGPTAQLTQSLVMCICSMQSGCVAATSTVGPSNSRPPVSGPPTTPAESMGVDEHVRGGRNQVMGMLRPATPAILVVSTTLNTWTTSTTFPCVDRFIIDLSSAPIPSHLPYRLLLARVNS
ncbi:hypothetical protein BS47DRAFT_1386988 [Hydnum rufescens UP504]|uniref:Uncharacterized protein n=1 Tax=Hydnum rufescens UP504 TaxID=1448309 RepID=A0A9P6BAK4_9AGAM|nr:hypothetical protein BS47DRAFT_1386988 [Hydnum rufescens UP504]